MILRDSEDDDHQPNQSRTTMIRHPLATLVALSLSVATLSIVAWLPTYLAPEESLTELLPTYVGVVGYRFEAHTATDSDTQEVVVDLGPSESAPSGPSARRSARPYLALPWLDSTDPAMQLTSRCSRAAGGKQI